MPGATALPVLRLAWQPDRAELADALRVLLRLRRRRRAGALLLGGLAVAAGSWATGQLLLPWLALVVLLLALVVLPVHRLAAQMSWRRDPRLRTEHTAEVVPGEGLSLTIGDVASAYRWSAFSGVLETDAQYLLTLPRGRRTSVLPLPKRAAAPGDADALRAVLAAALGEPVRAR
ncbi:YcxB family protein [Cellulomonas sp. PS-H5]|uniref:YcxB family protein n=1 Tax=Cellulomonas sp. PS-H5 TaxID=2820400 RepID=UPI001C4F761A|nr:YcxB family protein [Cellulomonas sp. PS-H5]MBW0255671.1 YcxB family protein [Cellulomonas sp. PS-H5]